jgi:hypothetical protein
MGVTNSHTIYRIQVSIKRGEKIIIFRKLKVKKDNNIYEFVIPK